MRLISWLIVPVTLVAAGCQPPTAEGVAAVTQPTSERVAAASQAFGMLLDTSVETALGQTTASGSTRAQSSDSLGPDLRTLPTTATIDLATATIGNRLIFPSGTAAGTITLTLTGAAAVSWPVGSVTLYDGSVTVAMRDIVLSNANGDRLRIPTGTFTYDLQAQSTVTDATNWVLTSTASAAVSPPLAAFLDRQGRTWSLSLAGSRAVRQVTTRQQTISDGRITSDTRHVVRTISGTTPGTTLTSDAPLAAYGFSRWSVTLGDVPVVWSRNAETTTMSNFIDGTEQTTVGHDATFVSTTLNARVFTLGPFTARQMGSLLGATLDPNWL